MKKQVVKRLLRTFVALAMLAVILSSFIGTVVLHSRATEHIDWEQHNSNQFYSASELRVGDYIHNFGGLNWRVLANTREGILIRTDRALPDMMLFDRPNSGAINSQIVASGSVQSRAESGTNLWQQSEMRSYLNGEFLQRFDARTERNAIVAYDNQQLLWWGDATRNRPGMDNTYVVNWTPAQQQFVGSTFHNYILNSSDSIVMQNANTTAYRYTMRDLVFLPDVTMVQSLANNGEIGANSLSGLRNSLGRNYHRVVNQSGVEVPSWLRTPNAGLDSSGSQVLWVSAQSSSGSNNNNVIIGSGTATQTRHIAPMLWISPSAIFNARVPINADINSFNTTVTINGVTMSGLQGGGNYRVFGGLFMSDNMGYADINIGDYIVGYGGIDWRIVNFDEQGIELRTERGLLGPVFDSHSDTDNSIVFNNHIVNHNGSHGRRHISGSNNYVVSNARAWLNNMSSQERLAQLSIGTANVRDWQHDGFLSRFSAQERDLMQARTIRYSNWWGDNVDRWQGYTVQDFSPANERFDVPLSDVVGQTVSGSSTWSPNEQNLNSLYNSIRGHNLFDAVYLPSMLDAANWSSGTNNNHTVYGVSTNQLRNSNGLSFNIVLNQNGQAMPTWTRSAVSSGNNMGTGSHVHTTNTLGNSFGHTSVDSQGVGMTPIVNIAPVATLVKLDGTVRNVGEIRDYSRFRLLVQGDEEDEEAETIVINSMLPSGRIDQPYSHNLHREVQFELLSDLPYGLRLEDNSIVGTPTHSEERATVGSHTFEIRQRDTDNIFQLFVNIDRGYLDVSDPYGIGIDGVEGSREITATTDDTVYTVQLFTEESDRHLGRWVNNTPSGTIGELTYGIYQLMVSFVPHANFAGSYEVVNREVALFVGRGLSGMPESLPSNLTARAGDTLSSVELPNVPNQYAWRWIDANAAVGTYGVNRHAAWFSYEGYHPIEVELEVFVQRVDQSESVGDLMIYNVPFGTLLESLRPQLLMHDARLSWLDSGSVGPVTNGTFNVFDAGFVTEEAYANIKVNISVSRYVVNTNQVHTDQDRTVWFDTPKGRVSLKPLSSVYGQQLHDIGLPQGFRFGTNNNNALVGAQGIRQHRIIYTEEGVEDVEFFANIEVGQRSQPTNWVLIIAIVLGSVLLLAGAAFLFLKRRNESLQQKNTRF